MDGCLNKIRLEKISMDNLDECLRLSVTEVQKEFIASNAYSLCEAYALTNHESQIPMPYAIYDGNTMVGFVFVIYQPLDESDPDDDEDVYYLARLMIDKKHQGKGYGKAALFKLVELLKTFPHGPAKAIVLSCNPDNKPAYPFFLSFGFKEMGIQDDDGDNLLRLELE